METIAVTVKGKEVYLKGEVHLSGSFVMEPEKATKSEMEVFKIEDGRFHGVRRVDCSPNTGTMLLYGKKGVFLFESDPKKDPARFCLDWSLNSMAFIKDQFIDGAKFSDWYYFTMHVNALYRSCMWGLVNKLGLTHPVAKYYAKLAVKEVKSDLKHSRGVDLNAAQSIEDKKNDQELENREATKQLYNLTRK